tara:strand:- start:12721 stop:12933 length:213 start_codon:yes stop_codon:yes gene_type:complete
MASVIQIFGYSATASGLAPWNIYLFLAGLVGWLIVGLLRNDRAIALAAMLIGLSRHPENRDRTFLLWHSR